LKTKETTKVSLLIDDQTLSDEMAKIFLVMGVTPVQYNSLSSFWSGIVSDRPAFCLVDVMKMSEGSKVLKNHPLIQKEEIPLAFVYNGETRPLLFSTFELFHFGLVDSDLVLDGQLKNILGRVNKFILQNETIHLEKLRYEKLDEQRDQLVTSIQGLKEGRYHLTVLQRVCRDFETGAESLDFLKLMEKVFAKHDEIEEFACLQLSFNGQKLISPLTEGEKFRSIPSLWLGKTCDGGIEYFAQSMANQVAIDILGGELISLTLKGNKDLPQLIVFIKVRDEDFLDKFNWDFLESFMNGVYSMKELSQIQVKMGGGRQHPWDLFTAVDNSFFGKIPGSDMRPERDPQVIHLHFRKLIETIKEKKNIRFYWDIFYRDFLTRLEGVMNRESYQVYPLGIDKLVVLVQNKEGKSSECFEKLKKFTQQFSYWRYFEDSDTALSRTLYPSVKMIPASTYAMHEFDQMISREIKTREEVRPSSRRVVKQEWEDELEFETLANNFSPSSSKNLEV